MTQALPLPPLEVLQKKFIYNPETGELTHRENTRRLRAGDTAGYPTQRGWLRVKVDGIHYRVHRIAWKMHYGEDPPQGLDIDHINQLKIDNRISNLRLATRKENVRNSSTVTAIILTTPHGKEILYESIEAAAEAHDLGPKPICAVCMGHRRQHKGFTARYA